MKIPKVGSLVTIHFVDHAEDSSHPIKFMVHGRIAKKNRKEIAIDCWEYANLRKPYDSNEKRFAVVRRCISDIYELTRKGE